MSNTLNNNECDLGLNCTKNTSLSTGDVLDMVGLYDFLNQIPVNVYLPGDRLIILIPNNITTQNVNDFLLDNCLKVISYSQNNLILEFRETIKHFNTKPSEGLKNE